jgi:WD40 repeat protein
VIGDFNSSQLDLYYDTILNNNEKIKSFKTFHTLGIKFLKYLPLNNLVASCSLDKTVKVWNPNTDELLQKYIQHNGAVLSLDQIDEDTLVSGSVDETIHVWKISTGQNIKKINASAIVYSVKFLSNYLIACGLYDDLRIYNATTGNLVKTLTGHTYSVYSIDILSEQFMASGSGDKKVIIWDLNTFTNKHILTGHLNSVKYVKRLSSYLIASGDFKGLIICWNWSNGTLLHRLYGHINEITTLDLFDDQTLISGSMDQTIKFWSIKNGQLMQSISTKTQVGALAMLNRGKKNLTCSLLPADPAFSTAGGGLIFKCRYFCILVSNIPDLI